MLKLFTNNKIKHEVLFKDEEIPLVEMVLANLDEEEDFDTYFRAIQSTDTVHRAEKKKADTAKRASFTVRAPEYEPGAEISYHPELIKVLEAQQNLIKGIMADIVVAANKKNYSAVKSHLKYLKVAINDHALKESVLLYMYLKNYNANDTELQDSINLSHRDKTSLTHSVYGIIHEWMSMKDFTIGRPFLSRFYKLVSALTVQFNYDNDVIYPLYELSSSQS